MMDIDEKIKEHANEKDNENQHINRKGRSQSIFKIQKNFSAIFYKEKKLFFILFNNFLRKKSLYKNPFC